MITRSSYRGEQRVESRPVVTETVEVIQNELVDHVPVEVVRNEFIDQVPVEVKRTTYMGDRVVEESLVTQTQPSVVERRVSYKRPGTITGVPSRIGDT